MRAKPGEGVQGDVDAEQLNWSHKMSKTDFEKHQQGCGADGRCGMREDVAGSIIGIAQAENKGFKYANVKIT